MRSTQMLVLGCIITLTGCSIVPPQSIITHSGQQLSGTISGQVSGTSEGYQPPLTNNLTGTKNEYTLLFDNTSKEKVSIYHQAGETTKLFFTNTKTGSMNAQVTFNPIGSGNLRLSQIIMPDGTMDGPFGQNITYNLTQLGSYQLLFKESMMTGDPWSGNALITVTLP